MFPHSNFSFHLLSTHFIQFYPPQPSKANSLTSSNTPASLKPSHWRYLFPATNHSYLNSDKRNQNLIHLLFFSFRLTTSVTYIESWKKKKAKLCSNIWPNVIGKINTNMIILKKSFRKSITPPFLKRPIPIPYFHRLSIIYQIPLWDRQIKFTPSSLRKKGGSELRGLKKNIRKKWVNFFLENRWSTMLFLIETGEEEVA